MAEASGVWAAPPDRPVSAEWSQLPRMLPPARSAGERLSALTAWAACGLTLAASVLLFPVGLLALPIPILVAVGLASRGRAWPEVLGLGLGVSAFLGYVAYRNRDSNPCDGGSSTVVLSPGREFRCSGTAPEPWLAAAVVILGVAAVVYVLALLAGRRYRR